MANSYKTDYFGLSKIVSAIIAFFFGAIVGGIQRIMEGKMVAGIVRIVIACTGIGLGILNIVDMVLIILNGRMLRVINS